MNNTNYACIFGGGAIRGIAYLGALKALNQLGIASSTLAGASVGSIFAALVAVGYEENELKEIFMNVTFDLFKDIHFGFGKDFAISKGEIFLEWARDCIEKKFYGENYKKGTNPAVTFKDLDKNLIIVTTDFTNFQYKEFSKFETPDFEIAQAIRISCAMPGLMRPVSYNNLMLIDGDLLKSSPIWKLSKTLAPKNERVLEFRLEGDFENNTNNAINFANTLHSCISGLATNFVIKNTGDNDKIDYIKINTGSTILVDFNQPREKREKLIETGYNQTMAYFKEFLPEKKQKLLPQYSDILKYLNKIEFFINSNRILNAKNEIGMLFVSLADYRDFIDIQYYNTILDFKNMFFDNLKTPSLFGKHSLKNKDLISKNLKNLISNVNERLEDIKSYNFS